MYYISWIPSIFCLILVILTLPCSSVNTTEFSEVYALKTMYDALNGEYWDWRATNISGNIWNFSDTAANPCNELWQGIACSCSLNTNVCNIVSISLNSYGLIGTFSDLRNLSLLSHLDLSNNAISGSLYTIPNMTQLIFLKLDHNLLTGDIASVSHLSQLTYLSLDTNYFSGDISTIGNLTLLNTLDLGIFIHTPFYS